MKACSNAYTRTTAEDNGWNTVCSCNYWPIFEADESDSNCNTDSAPIATIFLHHCVMPHRILPYLLAYDGSQFVGKFFKTLCSFLGLKKLTATAYDAQTSPQVERYSNTILGKLRHYTAEHKRSWDLYTHLLTCVENLQTDCEKRLFPFAVTLPGELSSTATLNRQTGVPEYVPADTPLCELKWELLHSIKAMKIRSKYRLSEDGKQHSNVTSKDMTDLSDGNQNLL